MSMLSTRPNRSRPTVRPGWLRVSTLAALTAVLASFLTVLPATTATAATRTFLIDSLSPVGDDANIGDGICATSTGACTLRAALQEANATDGTDTVTIAPAADVDASTPGVQTSGTIVGNATTAAAWMYAGALTPLGDGGAYFMATAPVTLDFQGRLGISSLNDAYGSTAIYINGPGVTLRNFSNVKSNETALVVGPNGDGAVIENGSSLDPGSIDLERFLWLANGADQVTVRNVEIGSTYAAGGSAIRIAAGATIDGLTLDRVHMFDPDTERYTGFQGQGTAQLSNLTIVGSTFEGFGGANHALDLRGLTLTNAQIVGNRFIRNNLSAGYTLIYVNTPGLGATNVISGNVFDNAGPNAGTTSYAIYTVLAQTVTQQSGWRIEDNYFAGFTSSSVYLFGTGILTAQRNTFGTTSFGGIGAANETSATSMLTNATAASNAQIATWFPTTPTSYDTTQCTLSVAVTPPTAGAVPTTPVSIDVYYLPTGSTSGATVYLGRQTLSAAGPVTVPYTLGAGLIRVQTIDATGRSSQYSRTVTQPQADLCGPRVTVDQASSQADPTSVRDLQYTVVLSEPLATSGAGALAPSDFSTVGSTALGARVTTVTKVNDTRYTVTARADATGTVVLSLPAGAVADALGNLSAASTSTDGSVEYVSPLSLGSTSISVAENAPPTAYSVLSSLSATAPVFVVPTVGTPAWAAVDPVPAILPTTATSVQLRASAVDDAEVNGTRQTTITHTVTSDDPNFDGLVLPTVALTVHDDDGPVAALSTLTVTPGAATADGVDTHTATVTARNSVGVPVSGALVAVSVSPGASPPTATCTTAAGGTCTVPITSTTPGSYVVTATLDGVEIAGSPGEVTFGPGAADTGTSTIEASVYELEADGSSTTEITVRLRDAEGNPLTTSGGTVVVVTDAGTVGGVTDNGDGTYTATLTAPEEVSVATVGFTLDSEPGARTVTVTFVAGVASPARSTIAAADPAIVADGVATTQVTVSLLDGRDNALTESGGSVAILSTQGTVSGTTDNEDGTYTATLTAPEETGTAVLSFTLDGIEATATTSVDLVAGPVDLTTSTIVAAPSTVTADGISTSVVTVDLRDAFGNSVTTAGGDVLVATDLGSLSGTTDRGNGSYTATLTAPTAPGTATLTFTVGGLAADAEATVDFVAGAADVRTSTIEADPTVVVADGTSTSTLTVRLRDAQGTPLTISGGPVEVSTDLGEVTVATDNLDGTYTATLTSEPTVGLATISFSLASVPADDVATVAFVAGPADPETSEISASPTVITADGTSTSTVTVQLRDAQGNPVAGSGDSVSFTTDLGTITAMRRDGGSYTTTLTAGTTAGTARLGFAVNGVEAPATAEVELVPGAVDLSGSTIVATPASIVADGTSTSQVVVQLRDLNGNAVASTGRAVDIVSDLGTVGEITDVGDGSYTATLTSSAAAGTATVSFTLDGDAGAQTATVELVAGALDLAASTVTASPTSIVADGTSTSTITVTLTDALGNPTGVPAGTVVITSDLGTVGEVTDVGDGTYTATLTSSATAGTATVSFTLDGDAGGQTATVELLPGAVDLTASTITASPVSIVADGATTSTVTVTLVDANGNPTGASGGEVVVLSDLGSVGDVADLGDGTYTATLTSGLVAGTATLSFTLDGAEALDTASVDLTPGAVDPGLSTVEASPTSITADGASTSTITVRLLDANGNPLTASGGVVAVTSTLGDVGETVDEGDGTYTAVLTSTTTAGVAAVGFTLDGEAAGPTTPVTFVAGSASIGTSTIQASPTSITADGTSTSLVTVRLLDENDNPLPASGGVVVITTDLGTASGVTDVGDGTYTATLTAGTVSGPATLSFTLDGAPATATTTVDLLPAAADAGTSTIEASPTSLTADGASTSLVTVRLLDANGNSLGTSGGLVFIGTDLGSISGVTDVGDGTYTATLTAGTVSGPATLSFTLDGAPATATTTVDLLPAAADAGTSTIEASPTSIAADGVSTSTITVRLLDANDNPLGTSGGDVVIGTDLGSVGDVTDVGDGTYTATLTAGTSAGVATLTFTLDGTPGTRTATVALVAGAGDTGTSTIEASPTSLTADGTSTSTVTVRLLDSNGNPLGASGGDVVIATTLGTVSGVIDVGDGTYTAELTAGTVAGVATLSFTLDGVTALATATVDLLPGAADPGSSTIEASPTSITADGTSTSLVTVRLLDANGNPLGASGGDVVIGTDLGSVGDVVDVGDGTYVAVLTAGTVAGLATVSFTLDGTTALATATVDLLPAAADAGTSTIEASPMSLTADGSSTSLVTVSLLDANGNALGSSGGVVVVGTDLGSVSGVDDVGDGTYTATLTAGTVSGPATVSFTLDGEPADATVVVDLLPAAADAGTSTIEASPTSITADGTSTSLVTVRLLDANGNALGSSGGVVVIETDLGSVSGVTDVGDGSYTAELTAGTLAGVATLSFTLDGASALATATVDLLPAAADAGTSTIEASPTSITADGVSTSTITVRLLDANDNPLGSSGGVVVIGTDLGSVGDVTDVGDGTYTAELTAGTLTGTATLTFTLDGTGGSSTASVALVAGAADAGTSTIEASPTSLTADGTSTSTVTVRLLDANGNALGSSGGVVVIETTLGTVSGVTDVGDGTYTAELTSPLTTGTATLSFTLDGAAATATAPVELVAGAADAGTSTIEASPTLLTADGVSTSTVTVRLRDANGNPLTSDGAVVTITSDLGAVGGVTGSGDGSYTAVFTAPTTVGSATIVFTVDGAPGTQDATVDLVAGPPDATQSTVEVFPSTVVADGVATAMVTVRLTDAQGNPATSGGDLVTVTTDSGSAGTVTDVGDGTYTATLTSPTTAGAATVGFTLDGVTGAQTAPVLFVAGPADPSTSTVEASPTSITASGSSTSGITVRLRDAHGNPLTASGGTVVVTSDRGSVSGTADVGDGTYTALLVSSTTAGTATITFTLDGVLSGATAAVTFVPGTVDLTTSTVEASPGYLEADGVSTSTVTVRLRDSNGNPLVSSGGTVVVTTDAGSISGTQDLGDGTYTATLTSSLVSGTATLGFTVGGAAAPGTTEVVFVAGEASPVASTIEASPTTLLADGTATSEVTVRLNDSAGNPLTSSGGTVVVSTTAGTVTAATDNGDGTYTATLTAASSPGTAELGFTVGGLLAEDTATVDLVVGAADGTTSVISASVLTLVVGDEVESVLTVQLRDAAGNALTTSGGAVVISADAGNVSTTTDNGDGTYTAVLTAPLVAGQATVSYTLDGAPGSRTLVVTFVEGDASPATSQITASPETIVADGVDASTVTVRLLDGYGNPLVASGGTVLVTTTRGDLTATTDVGDGTYTAVLSGTVAGRATLGFSIDGNQASATADVLLVAGPADAASSTISASPTVVVADGVTSSAVTVRLVDAQGNPVAGSGGTVTLQTDLGTLSAVVDNGDGSWTGTLTSATTAGTATVSFAVDGVAGTGTATVEMVAGAPSPTTSTLTAAPTTIEAGGAESSTLTVQLLDANGNPATSGGAVVVLTADLGDVSATVDHGDGSYSATLTSLETGTATVGFTVGGTTATATATVEVVDTTPPDAPQITAPADGSRVGPTVQLVGSGEPGATLTVLDGVGAEVCTTVVTTSGTWTCAPGAPLPEGPTTFVAHQVDPAGNQSEDSAPVSVTVDGTPPPAPVLDPTAGDVVTGSAEPGTTVTVTDPGGNVLCTTTAGDDGRFVCEPAERIPGGTLLTVTATDEAGNVSAGSVVRVGGPSVRLEAASLTHGSTQVAYGRGFLPGESVSGLLESTPVDLGTQVADAEGAVTFTFTVPADLEVGTHTVTLTGERSGAVVEGFEVVAAPVVPTPVPPTSPTAPPTGTPPAVLPGAPGTGSPDGPGGSLSATGTDPAAPLTIAGALLLLGLALMGAVRRRRRGDL